MFRISLEEGEGMRWLAILQVIAIAFLCAPSGAPAEDTASGVQAEDTASGAQAEDTTLPPVVLEGETGGTATGGEWRSCDLAGKTNLIMYVDTGKRQQAMPLINRIDSLRYSPDTLGVSFVINTSATSIPSFMIRMMIKQREKANSRIRYVLDKKEVLIKEWDFTNEYLNILILDSSGKVLHRYAGEITEEYIDEVISIIDRSLKNRG
jgi:predicted transcriptional regulator